MGGRVPTMNSTATCSTCKGMGSVRLYLARDSPYYDENKQPCHTESVAARVNKDRAFHRIPGRRCQVCCWCIIEDSWKRQHHYRHMEHKDTKSCRTPGTNIIIINPLTARVVGAPQMILQPVFSIFPCSPLLSGTCRTPGLSIP